MKIVEMKKGPPTIEEGRRRLDTLFEDFISRGADAEFVSQSRSAEVEVEMTNPQETQTFAVKGQRGVLPEKKKTAKLY